MLLKYIQNHKSIEQPFQDISLPDFVILTGKNGSGKTHLLNGIKESKFKIDDIDAKDILYLSYLDFAQNFQTRTSRVEHTNAWDRFNSQNNPGDAVFQLKQQGNALVGFQDLIEQSANALDKPIFDLSKEDLQSADDNLKQQAYNAIIAAKTGIEAIISQDQYLGEVIVQSVADSVLRKTKILPSNITDKEFLLSFQKTFFGASKILTDLSSVFFEYYKNIDRNERNERKGRPFLSDEAFVKRFGPAPWGLIRNIFVGFGLHFDINDPIQEDIDPLDGSFGIVFKNIDRAGKVVNFADLSSGEQILITLVNAIYTAVKRKGMPKVILLDEIDSPLNPSIIDKFILYVLENFVANGIKVIIATHSPSTVAFAPNESIYLVNTRNAQPLVHTDTSDAIDKLSEGFITLSDVVKFEKMPQSKIIISEGKNYKYLERAKHIFAPNDNELTILNLNIGGTSQLRTLFEFMRNFNAIKTFIFVFDCDYRYKEIRDDNGSFVKNQEGTQQYENRNLELIKEAATNRNRFFIFPENADSKSARGIENLFSIETSQSYSGEFDEKSPKNKKGFEKYILTRNETNDFNKFKTLFDFVEADDNTNF